MTASLWKYNNILFSHLITLRVLLLHLTNFKISIFPVCLLMPNLVSVKYRHCLNTLKIILTLGLPPSPSRWFLYHFQSRRWFLYHFQPHRWFLYHFQPRRWFLYHFEYRTAHRFLWCESSIITGVDHIGRSAEPWIGRSAFYLVNLETIFICFIDASVSGLTYKQ